MDTIVLVLGIIIAIVMVGYFVIVYRNQRLSPEKVAELKQDFYNALIDGGVKDIYNTLEDVPLMDEYKALGKEKVGKGHIAKHLEIACKKQIIEEIFKDRGIEIS